MSQRVSRPRFEDGELICFLEEAIEFRFFSRWERFLTPSRQQVVKPGLRRRSQQAVG